mgnify:CR=1 FL=1
MLKMNSSTVNKQTQKQNIKTTMLMAEEQENFIV